MGAKDEGMRLVAHEAWIQAKGDHREALQLFRQHPGSSGCKRPGRFILRWGKEFSIRKSLSDRKRSGRPRKLDAASVSRAAKVFTQGHPHNGGSLPFTSINEAVEQSSELKEIVSTHAMSPRTLLRNMQKARPDLVKRTEDLKPPMDSRLKQLRMSACDKLLDHGDQYFKRIFWLDAKTMHIVPKAKKVWIESRAPIPVRSDPRLPRSGRDRRTLHFYAMVNWCVGPVAIRFVTGTSGLQHEHPYMVSH